MAQNRVKACILIPNFHNPLGYVMSPSKKKALVGLLAENRIPIIEDDIYGDLYFGQSRPQALKTFDQKGEVLYCASFSKTLAPGLRVGWTIPGKYYDRVKRIKFNTSISSPGLNQHMVSEYLKTGSYDRHLRRLRNALKNQISNFALAIARYFPADTKITAPRGGLVLWVQLNKRVDGLAVYYQAQKQGISIFPGIIFSSSNKYRNCIRINCGYLWNQEMEKGIKTLAQIISSF
jgi:DNA-binding transcriptional MocR family regulator